MMGQDFVQRMEMFQIVMIVVAVLSAIGTLVLFGFVGWILLRWVRAYESRGSAKVVKPRQVDLTSRVDDDSRYMPRK